MYTTAELIALLDDSRESSRFAIRNFFNQVILSEERQIAWDVVNKSRRISPFVMPKVDGKVMEKEGFYTKFIAPAYIKDKCAICPTDALIRRAGEDFSMPTSPQARLDALVVQGLRDAEQRVENRLEVMAMELIRTGTVTLTGEDYPTTVIDMGRAADLDVNVTTLSGPLGAGNAVVWSDGANNNVLDNIEELSQRMSLKDEGAPATDLIFGKTAWQAFRRNQDVNDQRKLLINRDTIQEAFSSFNLGPLANAENVSRLGILNDEFRLWRYDENYEDDTNTRVPYVAPNEVLFLNPGQMMGMQLYGPVIHVDALRATRMYPHSWQKQDGSGIVLQVQSAPMVALGRPNATARLIIDA